MQLRTFLAGCFGIVGFVASLLSGLYVNNSTESILGRALLALIGCYAVGYLIGLVAQSVAREHSQRIAAKVAELDKKAADDQKTREAQIEQNMTITNPVIVQPVS